MIETKEQYERVKNESGDVILGVLELRGKTSLKPSNPYERWRGLGRNSSGPKC